MSIFSAYFNIGYLLSKLYERILFITIKIHLTLSAINHWNYFNFKETDIKLFK